MTTFIQAEHPCYGLIRIAIMSLKTGELYYEAAPVILAIDYINPGRALQEHCRDRLRFPDTNGVVTVISESDVHRLVNHSASPDAEHFRRWLLDDVRQYVLFQARQMRLL